MLFFLTVKFLNQLLIHIFEQVYQQEEKKSKTHMVHLDYFSCGYLLLPSKHGWDLPGYFFLFFFERLLHNQKAQGNCVKLPKPNMSHKKCLFTRRQKIILNL